MFHDKNFKKRNMDFISVENSRFGLKFDGLFDISDLLDLQKKTFSIHLLFFFKFDPDMKIKCKHGLFRSRQWHTQETR